MNKHRLNGYDTKSPEAFQLADCVGAMTDRAQAVLTTIQDQFHGDEIKLKDEYIYQAIETVLMEIKDINEVVNHFNQAQKSPDK